MGNSFVICAECGKRYKRLNTFHLRRHGLNEKLYLNKYPEQKLFSEETLEAISNGTKVGMRKLESWEKFKSAIASRNYFGENNPFFGKHHTEETKTLIANNIERNNKIAASKKAWWADGRIGLTVEEIYGKDLGIKLRKLKSLQISMLSGLINEII